MEIYLFSYEAPLESQVNKCLEFHIVDKYQVKHVNENVYLLKKQGDISDFETLLSKCLPENGAYSFIEMADYSEPVEVQDDEWLIILKNKGN